MGAPGTQDRAKKGRLVLRAFALLILATLLLAAMGRGVRDRNLPLSLLLYLPMLPLGMIAVALDLAMRGRGLGRGGPFILTILGCLALLWSIVPMVGWSRPHPPGDQTVRLVHWNVRWGKSGASGWKRIGEEVRAQRPDIIMLSEAPDQGWVNDLAASLGSEWTTIRNDGGAPRYRYQLAMASRWPMRLERHASITDGVADVVRIDAPEGPIHVMMVDAVSDPLHPRTPRLNDIAAEVRRAAEGGTPIDLIAGDFNTPGACIGFDQFKTLAGGYELASRYGGEWRGTWPVFLPFYDIDHVWVSKRLKITDADLFSSFATDHRGQLIEASREP